MSSIKKTWHKLTDGWLGILTYSLIGIVIALLAQTIGGELLDTDLPIVTVSSGSMYPELKVGDLVITKGEDDYEIGDVIVFDGWRSNAIIHRVVMTYDGEDVERYKAFSQVSAAEIRRAYEGEKLFVTKGDNNSHCDQCAGEEYITANKIHSKEAFKVPKIGLVKTCPMGIVYRVFLGSTGTDLKEACLSISAENGSNA